MMKKYKPIWVSPETHKAIKLKATSEGKEINKFLKEAFENELSIKFKTNVKKKEKFKAFW